MGGTELVGESKSWHSGNRLVALVALAAVALVTVAAAAFLNPPVEQPGRIDCLFYSAQSKSSTYAVHSTLSNNSTSPVAVLRVFFDGAELAHSADFPAGVGGIWSMEAGGQSTNALSPGAVGTLRLAALGANPDSNHAVRVTTNTSHVEFSVERKSSSLAFDDYQTFVGPGIDYMIAYVGNVGTATGNIVQVALDGTSYGYAHDPPPPDLRYEWSSTVGGVPTTFLGVGQQAQVYVNISGICHSCHHILRVACSDGSSVEFSFKP